MTYLTKLKLASIHQVCDAQDKSTEFMIQYMQDTCKLPLECVMAYMELSTEKKQQLFKDLNGLVEIMIQFEQIL